MICIKPFDHIIDLLARSFTSYISFFAQAPTKAGEVKFKRGFSPYFMKKAPHEAFFMWFNNVKIINFLTLSLFMYYVNNRLKIFDFARKFILNSYFCNYLVLSQPY